MKTTNEPLTYTETEIRSFLPTGWDLADAEGTAPASSGGNLRASPARPCAPFVRDVTDSSPSTPALQLPPAYPDRAAWGTATPLRAWQTAALQDYLARNPRDFLAVATRDGAVVFNVADVAASFQEAVCDVLTRKAIDAAVDRGVEDLLIGGGVAANSRLRALGPDDRILTNHRSAGHLLSLAGKRLRPVPGLSRVAGALMRLSAKFSSASRAGARSSAI